MPVRKFRSLEEMENALWREPGDPALWRAIESVWNFADQTCPRRFPPGVYRHRSIEDAERQREQWDQANFEAFWRRQRLLRGANYECEDLDEIEETPARQRAIDEELWR